MSRTRAHSVALDTVLDLVLVSEALFELVERARREGDRGTALVATDANESILALMDQLEHRRRTVPVRDPRAQD